MPMATFLFHALFAGATSDSAPISAECDHGCHFQFAAGWCSLLRMFRTYTTAPDVHVRAAKHRSLTPTCPLALRQKNYTNLYWKSRRGPSSLQSSNSRQEALGSQYNCLSHIDVQISTNAHLCLVEQCWLMLASCFTTSKFLVTVAQMTNTLIRTICVCNFTCAI